MLNFRKVNCCNRFLNIISIKPFLPSSCESSSQTQPAVQSSQDQDNKELKDFESLGYIARKPRVKKPQRPPFAKNLFLGKFDTEILAYPQLSKEDVDNLEKDTSVVSNLLQQQHMVNRKSLSDKYFRQNLSDYRMIGLQASQFMTGRECNITESFRYLETLCEHYLGENILNHEQLCVQTLIRYADEKLQKKYLTSLIKGELLSAFCLSEVNASDVNAFVTKAEPSKDGKTWIINGEKSFVIDGKSADVFIVFAVTGVVQKDYVKEVKFTAFIVDRNSSGLTISSNNAEDVETSSVKFNETSVPAENIIGEVDKAELILLSVLREFRLGSGLVCINQTKKLIKNMMQAILQKSNDANLLYKTDAITEKMGEALVALYAIESVLYLTTGLMDNYENQDVELECALAKVFCSQQALNVVTSFWELIGPEALDNSHWMHDIHRQIIRQLVLPQDNHNLKILLCLLGLQHAGEPLQNLVDKIRNPLFHGAFSITRAFKNRRNVQDNPKLDLELGDHLHPSCLPAAQYLEYCVKRLQFATEIVLVRYGSDVVGAHMDLKRMAAVIIDVYAMTAILGRASRSYCIGLQNAQFEMQIAAAYCNYAKRRVKQTVSDIIGSTYVTNDDLYRSLSKRLFKFKDYYFKHPLSRNF